MILNASEHLCLVVFWAAKSGFVASAVQPFAGLQTPKIRSSLPVCFSKLQYCVNFLLGKDVIFGGRCNCECTVSVCACACVCASVCVCLCVERGLKRLKTSRSVSAWHLTSFSISMMAVTFTLFLFEHRRGIRECLFGIIMGVSPTPLPPAPQNCETQRSLTHHIFTYFY